MLRAPTCSTSAYLQTSAHLVDGHDFGDDGKAGLLACFGENLQALLRPGPGIRRGLVRGLKAPPRRAVAPASLTSWAHCRSCSRDSTEQGPAMSADFFAAGRSAEGAAEGDDGAVLLHFFRGHFVFGEDGHDFLHARGVFDVFLVLGAVIAEGGDDGALGAFDDVLSQAQLFDELDDVGDLGFGGVLFHYDDHGRLRKSGQWWVVSGQNNSGTAVSGGF